MNTKIDVTKLKGLPSTTARGFRRTARRTPDRIRAIMIFLAWSAVAGIPALALAVAAGTGGASVVSKIWSVPTDHAAAASVFLVIFALTLMLISPLIKMAWGKFQDWDHAISISKGMED